MSSTPVNTTEQPTNHTRLDPLTATAVDDGDHPPSSPENIPKSGDNPDPTTNNHHWNGDPMDWESWPTGRPGPSLPESRKVLIKEITQFFEQQRIDIARTEEKVFHLAEFSSTGREIFVGHVTEPELANWLKEPQLESRFRLLLATSQRSSGALFATYARRIFSVCGAPAAVLVTSIRDAPSLFHSFTDSRDGNIVIRKTRQTTIVTTDLNHMHLSMIQHLKQLSGTSIQSEETAQLLVKCFNAIQEYFTITAVHWDEQAIGPEVTSRTLDGGDDHHGRVRAAEAFASHADRTRGDFIVFRKAFVSLEQSFRGSKSPFTFNAHIRESLNASFTEQKELCEVTSHLFDNIVSRYDRFLNLLLNYTNIQMVEQNSKMTAEMKEIAKQNAEQTTQSARQAQSMAVIAYDTKRDSEVMKAITVVTLVFLPATFVSTIFSMGFFNIDYDQIEVSRQGWIYLTCTLPLTFLVVGASFVWIWWTGRKEAKPIDYSASQVLAQAADTLRLGAGPRKESI